MGLFRYLSSSISLAALTFNINSKSKYYSIQLICSYSFAYVDKYCQLLTYSLEVKSISGYLFIVFSQPYYNIQVGYRLIGLEGRQKLGNISFIIQLKIMGSNYDIIFQVLVNSCEISLTRKLLINQQHISHQQNYSQFLDSESEYPQQIQQNQFQFYYKYRSMTNQEELLQIKQKYLDSLNRVNLLLVKQHELRRDEKSYQIQLDRVNNILEKIRTNQNKSLSIVAQDQYLRFTITENQKQINKLERKLQGQQVINQVKQLRAVHQKYFKLISKDYQYGLQEKLSKIRGKVDELKKKIKEINKDILSYEQEHLDVIDEYSLKVKLLDQYRDKHRKLKEEIENIKGVIGAKK